MKHMNGQELADFQRAIDLVDPVVTGGSGFNERHEVRVNIAASIAQARAEGRAERDAEVREAQVNAGVWMQAAEAAQAERDELRRQVAVKNGALRPFAERFEQTTVGQVFREFDHGTLRAAARALRAEKGAEQCP